MKRRDVVKGIALAGAGGLSLNVMSKAVAGSTADDGTQTAKAMAELLDMLGRKDASFADRAWQLPTRDDLAEARLGLTHTLHHALSVWLGADPARPVFRRWHYSDIKLLGDNPDSIYYDAVVSADHSYRIKGNIDHATYTSFTVEIAKSPGGGNLGKLGATLNDSQLEIGSDGSYEIIASAQPQKGNWLRLDPGAASITTRHYFEQEHNVAADPLRQIPLTIDPLERPGPAPAPTDASVAASLRRVTRWVNENVYPPQPELSPHWVSKVPNQFPAPKKDATNESVGYAAKDNVYSMAPFVLKPEEALIIRGRFPRCRFANIVLWNHFMQTFDYRYRTVSLNRKQTKLEKDGSFKMILAHKDPGLPNWLDTEGRMTGVMFWRFLLPEEDIQPLTTEVVSFGSVSRRRSQKPAR
jgi:hypothetical protein